MSMGLFSLKSALNFIRNKCGSAGPIFAVAALPIMFSVGTSVDFSEMYRIQDRLQIAADNAALYAISGYADGGYDEDHIDDLATKMVLSTFDINTGKMSILLDKSTSTLSVGLKTNYRPAFMGIAGFSSVPVSAFAKVKYQTARLAVKCFVALNETASEAVDLVGNALIGANACAVHVNSSSNAAIDLDGMSSIKALDVCMVGKVGDGLTRISPTPSKCDVIDDPFDNVVMPSVGACDHRDFVKNDGGNLYPGVYCGGISIGGNAAITFKPGLYIIKDGIFKTASHTKFYGNGVTFFFTGNDVAVKFGGGTTYDLTAMSTGEFLKGFIFYFDPNSDLTGTTSQFSGDSSTYFEGIMYFGKQKVDLNGNGSINSASPFSVLVADTIQLNGNASITFNVEPDKTDLEVPEQLYYRDVTGYLIN